MKWVTIQKLAELIGYTENAIRCKIKKGVWLQGQQWVKSPDGRILVHVDRVFAWIENRRA